MHIRILITIKCSLVSVLRDSDHDYVCGPGYSPDKTGFAEDTKRHTARKPFMSIVSLPPLTSLKMSVSMDTALGGIVIFLLHSSMAFLQASIGNFFSRLPRGQWCLKIPSANARSPDFNFFMSALNLVPESEKPVMTDETSKHVVPLPQRQNKKQETRNLPALLPVISRSCLALVRLKMNV